MKEDLNTLANLASLKTLNLLDTGIDLSLIDGKLYTIENSTEIIQTSINLLNAKIEELETLIQGQQSSNGLSFDLLVLNPTYLPFASNGWAIEPQSLNSLYDNDLSSASNLFQANGPTYQYGQIEMFPGISIPVFSKINFKVGIRNNAGLRAYWELAAYNTSLANYVTIWSYFGAASNTSDLICNVEIIIPFSWDKLRWKMIDIGEYHPQARFYDLKVWAVS